MTKTEIRELADRARNNPSVARGAFRKLAIENGFEGRSGGWIHDTNRPGSPAVVQGWQNLAARVYFGGVTFTSGVDMDALHAEALNVHRMITNNRREHAHGEALAEAAAAPVDHRAPLAPGEIRSQWVGNQFFRVMHISGGSFTQATVRTSGPDRPRVLATEMFEQDAVRAYADAIEQAEQCVDCGEPAVRANQPFGGVQEGQQGAKCERHAGPTYGRLSGRPVPAPRSFIDGGATCQRAENADFDDPHRRHLLRQGDACDLPTPAPAPVLADACCAFVEQGGITTHEDGCPRFWKLTPEEAAYRAAVREISTPAPTLANDVAALREKIGEYGGKIQDWRDGRANHPEEGERYSMARTGVATAWAELEEILDRVAARAPQRARDGHGDLLWLHTCGRTAYGEAGMAPTYCATLGTRCDERIGWRPLYVLPDGA